MTQYSVSRLDFHEKRCQISNKPGRRRRRARRWPTGIRRRRLRLRRRVPLPLPEGDPEPESEPDPESDPEPESPGAAVVAAAWTIITRRRCCRRPPPPPHSALWPVVVATFVWFDFRLVSAALVMTMVEMKTNSKLMKNRDGSVERIIVCALMS